eukprot:scaffold18427_cov61-Phaeocystis_antarctica.AAC.5
MGRRDLTQKEVVYSMPQVVESLERVHLRFQSLDPGRESLDARLTALAARPERRRLALLRLRRVEVRADRADPVGEQLRGRAQPAQVLHAALALHGADLLLELLALHLQLAAHRGLLHAAQRGDHGLPQVVERGGVTLLTPPAQLTRRRGRGAQPLLARSQPGLLRHELPLRACERRGHPSAPLPVRLGRLRRRRVQLITRRGRLLRSMRTGLRRGCPERLAPRRPLQRHARPDVDDALL